MPLAARKAQRASSRSVIVSITTPSVPPATSASICSRKTASIASAVISPSGARNSPVGPTEAKTSARSPTADLEMRAPARLTSRVLSARSLLASLIRLPPKVLVSTICAPLAAYARGISATLTAWVRFQRSGHSPAGKPRFANSVPQAPSRITTRRLCNAWVNSNVVIRAPQWPVAGYKFPVSSFQFPVTPLYTIALRGRRNGAAGAAGIPARRCRR